VALDPEHRLVVSAVVGKRTGEHTQLLVEDFQRRTGGRVMSLMTSDENPAYAAAILEVYGEEVQPERTGRPGRPRAPYRAVPEELQYATVHKIREGNRVAAVETQVVYGTVAGVAAALEQSAVSDSVNTAYVERHNGTDRNRNARKVRKSYCFSKDWEVHEAVSYFSLYSYNFCWPVRTLRERSPGGGWQQRTPAMAAGLADHVWPLREWLTFPAMQC
jgi:IS1 family transposase